MYSANVNHIFPNVFERWRDNQDHMDSKSLHNISYDPMSTYFSDAMQMTKNRQYTAASRIGFNVCALAEVSLDKEELPFGVPRLLISEGSITLESGLRKLRRGSCQDPVFGFHLCLNLSNRIIHLILGQATFHVC